MPGVCAVHPQLIDAPDRNSYVLRLLSSTSQFPVLHIPRGKGVQVEIHLVTEDGGKPIVGCCPGPIILMTKMQIQRNRSFRACVLQHWICRALQLCDSRSVFAIWEKAPAGSEHDAQISLSPNGLTLITEVLTTLALNLAAKRLDFW